MSNVIPFASSARSARLRVGLLRLTDSAPAIVAAELGYLAEEGIEAELSVEPSWANVADKLAHGFLDAAVVLPPLALALALGARGAAVPLIVPMMLSAGGNPITLATRLADALGDKPGATGLATALAGRPVTPGPVTPGPVTLGVVHLYSTHHLLLRLWLAAGGLSPGPGLALTVVPPAQMARSLADGRIDGFCAGAPWGEVASRAGAGRIVATSHDIWRHAPEKALAVRADWAEAHDGTLAGLLRALVRAGRFCDDPANAAYIASLLARPAWLGVERDAILPGLPGGAPGGLVFHRGATQFPWRSQALWFLAQMRALGQVATTWDLREAVGRVWRPDLLRAAVAETAENLPAADWKTEGAHAAPWSTPGTRGPLPMEADGFCDGTVFDPDAVPPTAPARRILPEL
jgi:NitT/TauT family transport system ATP-binding protein/nitrate/nitrite transport system substrate-binding protein